MVAKINRSGTARLRCTRTSAAAIDRLMAALLGTPVRAT
jgi:hypothetical protein